MAALAVVALAFAASAIWRAPTTPTAPGFDADVSDIAGAPSRVLGEPGSAKSAVEPDQPGKALAFVDTDARALAIRVAESPALRDAAQMRFADIREATVSANDVCVGVPRPTASEDIIDTEAFRIVDADVVVDVRITEFDEPATVDRVLQASRAAWDACDGAPHESGGSVLRTVLPFVSLAGTNGVNLQSWLLDNAGDLQSSSQTLAVPAGDILIEVRSISNGNLSTSVDPVAVLDDVESLR